jgi:hypothetical protein
MYLGWLLSELGPLLLELGRLWNSSNLRRVDDKLKSLTFSFPILLLLQVFRTLSHGPHVCQASGNDEEVLLDGPGLGG